MASVVRMAASTGSELFSIILVSVRHRDDFKILRSRFLELRKFAKPVCSLPNHTLQIGEDEFGQFVAVAAFKHAEKRQTEPAQLLA